MTRHNLHIFSSMLGRAAISILQKNVRRGIKCTSGSFKHSPDTFRF